jgi:Zn-dependent alcohol dehydrogenase
LETFARYGAVPETSLMKIDDDLPLSRAGLLCVARQG